MEREKIFSILRHDLAQELDVEAETMTPESVLDRDFFDSLTAYSCLLALEDKFGLEIRDEDAASWRTVNDVLDYLERRLP